MSFVEPRTLWLPRTTLIRLADALTVPDGGFSIQVSSGAEVRGGYAVADLPQLGFRSSGAVSGNEIAHFLNRHAAVLGQPHVMLGGWRSPETGVIHLDVSIIVPSLDQALRLARANGQEAIWDFAACESIAVDDVIDPP